MANRQPGNNFAFIGVFHQQRIIHFISTNSSAKISKNTNSLFINSIFPKRIICFLKLFFDYKKNDSQKEPKRGIISTYQNPRGPFIRLRTVFIFHSLLCIVKRITDTLFGKKIFVEYLHEFRSFCIQHFP